MKKLITLFCAGCLPGLFAGAGFADNLYYAPPPSPPMVHGPEPQIQAKKGEIKSDSRIEWTFHKSADGAHPDGTEQQLMWLMNRARSNPAAEGRWLATETDLDVAGGRDYFHVDLDALQDEFAAIAPKPPAAFDIRLYEAARSHSLDLIARNAQDHDGQFDRIKAADFHYTSARGCVFSYAKSGLNAHAGVNIDWGTSNDGTGMQSPRGHRLAIMSVDGDFANVGIAEVAESDDDTEIGPLVITGNYCKANTGYDDHFNVFLVGTAWHDENSNDRYDPGEGIAGITVTPDGGTYYAVTGDSGGYALPIDDGSYTVTFHGTALPQDETRNITVTGKSVLLDLKVDQATPIVPASPGSFPWPLFLPAIEQGKQGNQAVDCNGVSGGTAFMDHCNICVGGTTGKTACTQDCNGVWGGSAVLDRCGVCDGDGSSCTRFTRSSTGHLVTDTDTGLTWQDYLITVKEREEAVTYCNGLIMDGYSDWRFPTFTELQNFFRGVAADRDFDLNHWGSFSGCTASIADGGYVKTPVGAQRYGGNTGDRISFSGHAAVHCVRP